MTQASGIKIRLYNPETDKGFVFSSFLDGLYYGNPYYREIDKASYYKNYSTVVEHLLTKQGSVPLIACLEDDEDVILGFAILEANKLNGEANSAFKGDLLHYVFVKKAWRGKGIASALVPKNVTVVSHLTKPGAAIARKKGLKFDPFTI